MKKMKLTNKTHRTETTVQVSDNGTIKNMKRALKKLCGMNDCKCSGCDQLNNGKVYEVNEGVWKVR